MKYLLIALFVFNCIILSSCSTEEISAHSATPTIEALPIEAFQTGLFSRMIAHDNSEREYILYVPESYTGDKPVPLVFNFHGYTSYASQLLEYADFRPIADRAGFILVYPQGAIFEGATHWNVGIWEIWNIGS